MSTSPPISTTSPHTLRRLPAFSLGPRQPEHPLEPRRLRTPAGAAKRRTFPQTKLMRTGAQAPRLLDGSGITTTSFISRPNMVRGSTKVELWFSTLARRWPQAWRASPPPKTSSPGCRLIWTNTTPIGHIPIAGHTRDNPWYAPPFSQTRRYKATLRTELGSAPVHNHSNAASTRRAPIVVVRLTNCSQSYEMAI